MLRNMKFRSIAIQTRDGMANQRLTAVAQGEMAPTTHQVKEAYPSSRKAAKQMPPGLPLSSQIR